MALSFPRRRAGGVVPRRQSSRDAQVRPAPNDLTGPALLPQRASLPKPYVAVALCRRRGTYPAGTVASSNQTVFGAFGSTPQRSEIASTM